MIKINTYLNFAGNTEGAFNFYKSVFGGEFTSVVRFKDMPMEGVNIPKQDGNKIMHIGLPIRGFMLMGTDTLESLGQKLVIGNNVYISIHPENKEEADRIFNALSAGGKIEMPMADQPWGDYYGSFKDKFGVQWMINYHYQKNDNSQTMAKTITVETIIDAPVEKVWKFYTEPKHITQWNNASEDWHSPRAENDLRVNGKFLFRMEAKDGSAGFDFEGIYNKVKTNELISYTMGDGRKAHVTFEEHNNHTHVKVTFDPENKNPIEMQRDGWQSILNNFKKYTEVQNWINKLEQEGFADVRVCPLPPNIDTPEHTHDEHTVHIILSGGLEIFDLEGRKTYHPGDRVEFPAGTTHKTKGLTKSGSMIVGVKK